jgi:hypothetical protein
MDRLELELFDLGRRLDVPPGPDLTAAVRARLVPARRRVRAIALAFALLAVAFGAAMAVPAARSAILDFFGVRGVRIERVEELPPLPPSPPAGAALELGERTTVSRAGERVGFRLLLPRELGRPDEVWFDQRVPGGVVTFVYRTAGRPFLLAQFRGRTDPGLVKKAIEPGTRIEFVEVDGEPGYWLAGRPHVFAFEDADGEFQRETIRLAGNTLLWERGELTLRLEANVTKERALAIARSVG